LSNDELSNNLRQCLRDEIKSAFKEFKEKKDDDRGKKTINKILSYLSNGFILLIIGSIITAFLVPHFQSQFEQKREKLNLMHECFSQFLSYSNSAWEEYYSVFPLVHKNDMTLEEYNSYYAQIFKIKLQRYDAYSKIKALSIAFRENGADMPSNIENKIDLYAVKVNDTSLFIDDWIRNIYCGSNKCVNMKKAPVDPEFSSINTFFNLKGKDIKSLD
jgi:hypothetical protein